jgi:hypothetical protein
MIQTGKIENGIQAILPHDFFQGLDCDQTKFVGIIQTALLNRAHE